MIKTGFDVSTLPLNVHANRDYKPDQVRHYKCWSNVNSSSSGQFSSKNFWKLVEVIREVCKDKIIFFVDTRQDTHFELNNKPCSLKRIVERDDNTGMTSEEVIAKETAVAAYFVDKMVTFTPKKPHGDPWEEMVVQGACVREFIESQQWEGRHTYVRFSLNEHGPLTDLQVDEFLSLLKRIDSGHAWLHTNSIVGGAAALLLIIMKDMLKTASTDSLETIVARYENVSDFFEPKAEDENCQAKIERAAFVKEFYTFAKAREVDQKWSGWKARTNP